MQRLPAGRKHAQPGSRLEEVVHKESYLRQQLLEVVEHKQHSSTREVGGQRLARRSVGILGHPQDVAHGRGDVIGIAQRCAFGEPGTIGVVGQVLACSLERKARLATSTRAGQCHEAAGSQCSPNRRALLSATDEA